MDPLISPSAEAEGTHKVLPVELALQVAALSTMIIGGVVAALLAVFVITVIILVVVFVAVRRYYRHSDKLNIHSR